MAVDLETEGPVPCARYRDLTAAIENLGARAACIASCRPGMSADIADFTGFFCVDPANGLWQPPRNASVGARSSGAKPVNALSIEELNAFEFPESIHRPGT